MEGRCAKIEKLEETEEIQTKIGTKGEGKTTAQTDSFD